MQYLKKRCFFILIGVVFFSACAGVKEKSSKSVNYSSAQIQEMETEFQKRERVAGSGAVTWIYKKRSSAVSGILLADWQKGIHFELLDPLGSQHALVILNTKSFWSYFVENGYAYTGKVGVLNTKKILPIPLSMEEFLQVFLARPPISTVLASGKTTLEVDPITNQPLRWKLEKEMNSYIEVKYSDYRIKSGVYFPQNIRIQYVRKNSIQAEVDWHWNDFEAFISPLSQAFVIPPVLTEPIATKTVQ